jgi:hypothetical protein
MTAATMPSYYDTRRPGPAYWGSFVMLCVGWCLDFYDFYIVGLLVKPGMLPLNSTRMCR